MVTERKKKQARWRATTKNKRGKGKKKRLDYIAAKRERRRNGECWRFVGKMGN